MVRNSNQWMLTIKILMEILLDNHKDMKLKVNFK